MKRTILLLLLLVLLPTLPLEAATRKVQYVDTDVVGGTGDGSSWTNAYATLFAWEAQNTDLTGVDQYLDVYCRGATVDTTAVALNGWATDVTRTIAIHEDPNHYPSGTWSTSCYRLVPTAASPALVLNVQVSYVTIDGLQISHGNAAIQYGIQISSQQTVKNCILNGNSADSSLGIADVMGGGQAVKILNNILYGYTLFGIALRGQDTTAYNNTLSGSMYGFYISRAGGNTYIVKNNLVKSSTTACYYVTGSGGSLTTATNYTSDATSPDAGCGSATITFVGASDFHLDDTMSGTLLGTDLTGTFTTDIDGDTRDTWYAGADEIPATSSIVNNWWWRRRN